MVFVHGRQRPARSAAAGALVLFVCLWAIPTVYARQPPPSNDNLEAAAPIDIATSGDVIGTLVGATEQESEPSFHDASVWFRFTAPAAGRWVLDVTGDTTEPELVVFVDQTPATPPSFGDLQDVGYVSPDSTFLSDDHVVLDAAAGTTYFVAVQGPEDGFQFAWRHAELSRVLWRHTSGAIAIWTVNDAGAIVSHPTYGPFDGWQAVKLAVDKDGYNRVLWQHTSGLAMLWKVDGAGAIVASSVYGPYAGWRAADLAAAAYGPIHLAWTSTNGGLAVWEMPAEADSVVSSAAFGPYAGWQPLGIAVDGDLIRRILWQGTTGAAGLWKEFWPYSTVYDFVLMGPFAQWSAVDVAAGDVDESTRVLWRHQTGAAAIWRQLHDGTTNTASYGPFAGWQPEAIAVSQADHWYQDNDSRVLWRHTSGAIALWKIGAAGALVKSVVFGPFSGWSVVDLAVGPD
jgi:hypothetical protein